MLEKTAARILHRANRINYALTPPTRQSIHVVINATPSDFEQAWLTEALRTYMLLLAKVPFQRDPFEIFVSSDRVAIHSIDYKRTTQEYKSPGEVYYDLVKSIGEVKQRCDGHPIIYILEKNGTTPLLSSGHEALLEWRERTLRYVSGTIDLEMCANFDIEEYAKNPEGMVFNTITYKQYGSLLVKFPASRGYTKDEKSTLDLEVTENCYARFPNTLSESALKVLKQYFEFLDNLDSHITDPQTIELNQFKNAVATLLKATEVPILIKDLTSSLDLIIDSIENFDRHLRLGENTLGISWDLFAEALLTGLSYDSSKSRVISKLQECTNKSTSKGSFAQIEGYFAYRQLLWHSNDWHKNSDLKSFDNAYLKPDESVPTIVAQIESCNLIGQGEAVIKRLLDKSISIKDPNDAFWMAEEIARHFKNEDPELYVQVHEKAIESTSSRHVKIKSDYPEKNEWYRRIIGDDRVTPDRKMRKVFKGLAEKMVEITDFAKARSTSPINTRQELASRTVEQAITDPNDTLADALAQQASSANLPSNVPTRSTGEPDTGMQL